MDDLLQDFLAETNESLSALDVELIRLEENPDDKETLSGIFRVMHTIKGTCGFLGLSRLEKVAHAGENVLGKIRDGELVANPDIISVILECLDRIRMMMVAIGETGSEPEGDDGPLLQKLEDAASGRIHQSDSVAASATGEEASREISPQVTSQHKVKQDRADETPPEQSSATAEEGPAPAETRSEVASENTTAATSSRPDVASNQTIRVNLALLENLMTMVSELVLTRNQLLQSTRDRPHEESAVPLQRLNQIVSDLQEGVMKTRMQPIGNAWSKVPRLIRDLSRDLGKKISLEMEGAETELDRQVLEMIKDPLTHMIRNSVDHGLETPEERVAAGKKETGTVRLDAYHEGGHIIINISDDGRGVNVDRVRQKVIENGLATEAELSQMTEKQICQFIFKPGFSTATSVTAVSGRGVGMDVVRTNIEKIGGHIELSSKRGKGSRFTIKIPLTLAIVPALIVECAGSKFAIPQISVVELVCVSERESNRIEYVDGTPVLRLRDSLLPLVSLRRVLQEEKASSPERFIVIMRVGTYSFGILVDEILDTEEIVVKPVSNLLKDIPVFSGNTILGDGSVIMILDANGIAATTSDISLGAKQEVSATASVETVDEADTMLLFKSGSDTTKAIPLSLITRLEEIDASQIEYANGTPLVQYRGSLMPLVTLTYDQEIGSAKKEKIVVFSRGERSLGLVVDEIVDIVTAVVDIKPVSSDDRVIGTATIAGKVTEIVDVSFILEQIDEDWTGGEEGQAQEETRHGVLLVTPNDFYPSLVKPHLSAGGWRTMRASNAEEAARTLGNRKNIRAILLDLRSGNINGRAADALVEAARTAGTPVIGLQGREGERSEMCGAFVRCKDYRGILAALSEAMED